MIIPRSYSSTSIILLVQFFAVFAGTLITTAMLKGYGYPNAEHMHWNPVAVFIRNWGWLGLLIPVIWFCIALKTFRARGEYELSLGHIWTMVCATAILILFYVWTAMNAGSPLIITIQNVDM